jgi:succinate dehydrogenase/fumarate reductase-like Fe-S protein
MQSHLPLLALPQRECKLLETEGKLRIGNKYKRGKAVEFVFNGINVKAYEGETIAVALLAANILSTKLSVRGYPRGPVCLMGSCQECAVRIGGRKVLACQTKVEQSLEVKIDGLKT